MKKITLAISLLMITAATFAGSNNQKELSPEKRLDANLQDQVTFPRFLLEKEGEHSAEVHFRVNPDGTIAVKDIVTDEDGLKSNLLNQIKTFSVNTQGLDLNDSYKIVFRFNTSME